MRNPENVLNSLAKHSKMLDYKYERLYRILFNEEMYYMAYQRIYAKEGNMTEGIDKETIDNMSLQRVDTIINSIKDESYQPQPSKRVYIPKKNGKMRPLGIPSFNDKLVQEVVRMILEAIYERSFEYSSHGFRPKRSCQTALTQIQKSFSGVKWFIEGDIKGFFDNINHSIMISILEERIGDERFIRLIRKFLNAGYMEDWKYNKTYSGTPQGGIISPILANIYLDKLDKYMLQYIEQFDKGEARGRNLECRQIERKKYKAMKQLKTESNAEERKILIQQIRQIDRNRALLPYGNEMDEKYKRLKYVRYADDFLCGIIGSKADAIKIKEDIKNYLSEKLSLDLSEEKTLITHTEKNAYFLGYEITVRKSKEYRRCSNGRMRKAFNKRVVLNLPTTLIKKKLLEYGAAEMTVQNSKEVWKPKARAKYINHDDLEIMTIYNAEIRGLYNYYSIANNCSKMHSFKYIMEYSLCKTFARKYKTSVGKICKKYKKAGVFTVNYVNKAGKEIARTLYNDGFKRRNPMYEPKCDNYPNYSVCLGKTSLVDRLKAQKCEICGSINKLDMHHIRKLKDLKGKKGWEKIMIARKRKTIAVCEECHTKIHSGKLD